MTLNHFSSTVLLGLVVGVVVLAGHADQSPRQGRNLEDCRYGG